MVHLQHITIKISHTIITITLHNGVFELFFFFTATFPYTDNIWFVHPVNFPINMSLVQFEFDTINRCLNLYFFCLEVVTKS